MPLCGKMHGVRRLHRGGPGPGPPGIPVQKLENSPRPVPKFPKITVPKTLQNKLQSNFQKCQLL